MVFKMKHQNDFTAVKAAAPSLLSIITQTTGLKMAGSHLEKCPFCGHSSCFSLHGPALDRFRCHSSGCDQTGDVFDFIMRQNDCTKHEALKTVAEISGTPLKTSRPDRTPTDAEKWALKVFNLCTEHLLAYSGPNRDQVHRGHTPETLRKMQVGLSPGSLVARLRQEGCSEQIMEQLGIAKRDGENGKSKLVDFIGKGRLVYPVCYGGKLVNIRTKDPTKQSLPYQLPTAQQGGAHLYHQEALDRFGEVILVEGENDLLTLRDSGCHHGAALLGSLSQEQINLLRTAKHVKMFALMMDNDNAGRSYVRKLAPVIPVKVIVYGAEGDDPDRYLQAIPADKRRGELRRLEKAAVSYLHWELDQAARLPTLEERKAHLDTYKVWQIVSTTRTIEQQIYIEIIEALGFSRKAIIEELTAAHDLRRQLSTYYAELKVKGDTAQPAKLAEIIFDWFNSHGRFFHDSEATVFLTYHDVTYTIGSNPRFSALLERTTGILLTRGSSNSIVESLRNRGLDFGLSRQFSRWIHAVDTVNPAIFVNLNTPGNVLYRLAAGEIRAEINGMNAENILLNPSKPIKPFTFLPQVDIQEGINLFYDLVVKNLACEARQRYYIACWFISTFLLDYTAQQQHLKFSGSSAGGKSTSAKLLTMLLYGSEHLADPTGASLYNMAAEDPLVIIDNLESADLNRERQKFLLLAATRGKKTKRRTGFDSGTIDESPRALICITAIEPFTLPELINRVVDIWFDAGEHGQPDFFEMDILRGIKRHRDIILSALLKLIAQDILPEIGTLNRYATFLREQHPGHSKERSNEFLALLLLILDKLLVYLPLRPRNLADPRETKADAEEICNAWILDQNRKTSDMESSSSCILKLLDGLAWEHQSYRRTHNLTPQIHLVYPESVYVIEHPLYGIEVIETRPEDYFDALNDEIIKRSMLEFVATSVMVVDIFDRYCKQRGIRNPFKDAAIFGARLKNDLSVLKKSGWELVTKPGIEPYYRIAKGNRFFKFRKLIFNPTS